MARGLRSAAGFLDGGGVTPSPTPSLQLYKRRYGAVDYLVDVDGKLVTDDTVYVEVGASGNPNACVLSLCSVNQELSDIIASWGKTPAVFSSQELGTTDYTITIGDDFVSVVGEDATPAIEDIPTTPVYWRTILGKERLVDADGNVILFNRNGAWDTQYNDNMASIALVNGHPECYENMTEAGLSNQTQTMPHVMCVGQYTGSSTGTFTIGVTTYSVFEDEAQGGLLEITPEVAGDFQ